MKTKALTEAPFGSWKSHHWKEAIQTMYMWSEKEGSFFGRAESVLESFALLERALLEYKRSTSLKQKHAALESLDTELLNSVVDNWRTCWVQLQKPTIRRTSAFNEAEQQARLLLEFTVENMLSKISTYKVRSSGLIDPDRRTFLMIQDAATASQKRSKRSAFALDILARIAQENEQLLDYEMYTKFIKSCAKLGDAEQAESCLEHMYKQFDKTNKKDLKPDTKIFNLVLLAWSQSSADSKYASQRSRGILKRMQDLAESRGKLEGAVVPSYMSYSLVIKCLSNWLSSLSLTHENAEKAKNYEYVGDLAEELLREMDARSAKGVKMVKPNAVVYNSVLHSTLRPLLLIVLT